MLLTPQRRRQHFGAHRRHRALATFDAAGRWTLLDLGADVRDEAGANGARAAAVEHAARVLLRRYGVVFRKLIEHADVVIDNFTPGVLERWGIGYEQAREWNPGIVYLSLSGCGGDGPWRDYVTFAPTIRWCEPA